MIVRGPDVDRRDLYALPLDEFTAQRNALAKALRRDGRREEAAEVAKLRKPSVPAWAVNQLVREADGEIRELFAAGDALQRAQADLLRGKGRPDALRPAVEAERDAVERLAERAEELLPGEGSVARRQQIVDTLHAAALDADARERVMDGCLERELQHVGLGGFGGFSGAAAPATRVRKPAPKAAPARPGKSAEERERERREAEAARAARQAEAQARRAAERAERHLKVVRERREQLAEQLAELDRELEAAQLAAAEAATALEGLTR